MIWNRKHRHRTNEEYDIKENILVNLKKNIKDVYKRQHFPCSDVILLKERKKPVEKVGRQTVSGAESRKGGIRMWIMKFY